MTVSLLPTAITWLGSEYLCIGTKEGKVYLLTLTMNHSRMSGLIEAMKLQDQFHQSESQSQSQSQSESQSQTRLDWTSHSNGWEDLIDVEINDLEFFSNQSNSENISVESVTMIDAIVLPTRQQDTTKTATKKKKTKKLDKSGNDKKENDDCVSNNTFLLAFAFETKIEVWQLSIGNYKKSLIWQSQQCKDAFQYQNEFGNISCLKWISFPSKRSSYNDNENNDNENNDFDVILAFTKNRHLYTLPICFNRASFEFTIGPLRQCLDQSNDMAMNGLIYVPKKKLIMTSSHDGCIQSFAIDTGNRVFDNDIEKLVEQVLLILEREMLDHHQHTGSPMKRRTGVGIAIDPNQLLIALVHPVPIRSATRLATGLQQIHLYPISIDCTYIINHCKIWPLKQIISFFQTIWHCAWIIYLLH
ncbi:hypothetical protein RFI_32723 [Reticulomyxa filosa]|uniref:Uncharacterized protein n=1 Tax=Reticulomyxa filosa TaxID=46433 RepID=X6LRZ2_RETFI|nr:hypothetical protein RFI_32723 [Reticulomyxa filosa]|eukprot:ETO04678.1 hypothetical protein RFI_32723 [Reticulomyxa filosa]